MEEIRKYPVIYNKFCKDFRDLNKKQSAWEGIAKKFGLDVEEVTKNTPTFQRTMDATRKKE